MGKIEALVAHADVTVHLNDPYAEGLTESVTITDGEAVSVNDVPQYVLDTVDDPTSHLATGGLLTRESVEESTVAKFNKVDAKWDNLRSGHVRGRGV